MSKVVKLRPQAGTAKAALEAANSRPVKDAVICIDDGEQIEVLFSDGIEIWRMLGALEEAKHAILSSAEDYRA